MQQQQQQQQPRIRYAAITGLTTRSFFGSSKSVTAPPAPPAPPAPSLRPTTERTNARFRLAERRNQFDLFYGAPSTSDGATVANERRRTAVARRDSPTSRAGFEISTRLVPVYRRRRREMACEIGARACGPPLIGSWTPRQTARIWTMGRPTADFVLAPCISSSKRVASINDLRSSNETHKWHKFALQMSDRADCVAHSTADISVVFSLSLSLSLSLSSLSLSLSLSTSASWLENAFHSCELETMKDAV
jgi:hypothetical protein